MEEHLEQVPTVRSKRSSIEDLVLMRTKLPKWSSFSSHFTQKASFSHLIVENLNLLAHHQVELLHYMYLLGNGITQYTYSPTIMNIRIFVAKCVML